MNQNVKFAPSFQSFVDTSFFQELSRLKLDVFKLDSNKQKLFTSIDLNNISSSIAALFLRNESFQEYESTEVKLSGSLYNFNTIEEFKKCDKVEFLKDRASELLKSGKSAGLKHAVKFYVISFADLKKYKFYYWICVPSFQYDGTFHKVIMETPLKEKYDNWFQSGEFITCIVNEQIKEATPENLKICDKLLFKDFSRMDGLPASICKNFLTIWKDLSEREVYKICCLRKDGKSFQLDMKITANGSTELKVTGWEKNGLGKFAPKSADLSSLMDPIKIAEQSVDLNLKLMKWKIAPDIDLNSIKNSKVLLLGSGTLGCYAARVLLAWGTRHISFVDNSTVSFSNPVRQPLFNFDDCGRPKSEAASDSLKKIFPSVTSNAYQLEIPMIGHPVSNEKSQMNDYETLCRLFESHDVVFLLMDARETRWLPTVLGKLYNKKVINAALGFDSYLVMRHGTNDDNLGCYFCNDIVAPSDSLTDRTLDQMCTVTRPGVALMAASQAVELLVSSLQTSDTILGPVPHQIRGFLHEFKLVKLETPAYEHCSACSKIVMKTLKENGWQFVKQVLDNYTVVEKLSGLSKIQEEAELAMFDDDFDESFEFERNLSSD